MSPIRAADPYARLLSYFVTLDNHSPKKKAPYETSLALSSARGRRIDVPQKTWSPTLVQRAGYVTHGSANV
jgi:hypothetical protein